MVFRDLGTILAICNYALFNANNHSRLSKLSFNTTLIDFDFVFFWCVNNLFLISVILPVLVCESGNT